MARAGGEGALEGPGRPGRPGVADEEPVMGGGAGGGVGGGAGGGAGGGRACCTVHGALSAAASRLRGAMLRLCAAPEAEPTSAPAPTAPAEPSAQSSGPGPSPGSSSSCEEACKPPPRNCYRLVLLGSSRVGKTSIVARFLNSKFDDSYTPTIEDFHRKLYRIRGEVHQLDILDTSGNHPFPAMRRLSFLTGDLFVLVYSVDSRESFEEVKRLREQILETKLSACATANGGASTSRSRSKAPPPVPMAIAGNKSDKDMRTVSSEEAAAWAASQDERCVFVETSAKRNARIDDLFHELFVVAGLPLEMAPDHHKRLLPSFGSPCALPPAQPQSKAKKALSIKRRLSDACGVVAPNVRRPSIRTDLMIMRSKTCSLGGSSRDGRDGRDGLSALTGALSALGGLLRGRRGAGREGGAAGPPFGPPFGAPGPPDEDSPRRCAVQ